MPLCSAWKQFFFMNCFSFGERSRISGNKPNVVSNKALESTGGNTNNASDNKTGSHGRSGLSADSDAPLNGTKIKSADKAKEKSFERGQQADKLTVKLSTNKTLSQTDPLYHQYLICVLLITLSILVIRIIIPGMPIYTHTKIGFAFLLALITVACIYTGAKSRKVSTKLRHPGGLLEANLTLLELFAVTTLFCYDMVLARLIRSNSNPEFESSSSRFDGCQNKETSSFS